MDAQRGTNFLLQLLLGDQYPMDGDDLEEAIRIAGKKSPSSAIDEAERYYRRQHGSAVLGGYLGFRKGTRWLAMIRRDEGEQSFMHKADELRTAMGVCSFCLSLSVAASFARCGTCWKKGCQSCLARKRTSGEVITWHTQCQMPT